MSSDVCAHPTFPTNLISLSSGPWSKNPYAGLDLHPLACKLFEDLFSGYFIPNDHNSCSSSPHQSTEDDTYEGRCIPKGTIIIPNMWQLHRDPEAYGTDADSFDPSRYLGNSQSSSSTDDDGHLGFGETWFTDYIRKSLTAA